MNHSLFPNPYALAEEFEKVKSFVKNSGEVEKLRSGEKNVSI
jgi:hypothetical protein